jgi:hypothetical protein
MRFLVLTVTATLVCVSFVCAQQKPDVPDSWKQINICRISFFAPADLKDLGAMGVDTCMGLFGNNDVTVSIAYGRYIGPAVARNSDLEFKEQTISIDGRNARLYTYIDASHSNSGLYYNAALYVAVEEDPVEGLPKQISLFMQVRGERKKDQDTARAVLRSVRFQ